MSIHFDSINIPYAKPLKKLIQEKYTRHTSKKTPFPLLEDILPIFLQFNHSAHQTHSSIGNITNNLKKIVYLHTLSKQIMQIIEVDYQLEVCRGLQLLQLQKDILVEYQYLERELWSTDLRSNFFLSSPPDDKQLVLRTIENKQTPFYALSCDAQKAKKEIETSSLSTITKLLVWHSYYLHAKKLFSNLQGYTVLKENSPPTKTMIFLKKIENHPLLSDQAKKTIEELQPIASLAINDIAQSKLYGLYTSIHALRKNIKKTLNWIKSESFNFARNNPEEIRIYIKENFSAQRSEKLLHFFDPYGSAHAKFIALKDDDLEIKLEKLTKLIAKIQHAKSVSLEKIVNYWNGAVSVVYNEMLTDSLLNKLENLHEAFERLNSLYMQSHLPHQLYCIEYLMNMLDPLGKYRCQRASAIESMVKKCMRYGKIQTLLQTGYDVLAKEIQDERNSSVDHCINQLIKNSKSRPTSANITYKAVIQEFLNGNLQTEFLEKIALQMHMKEVLCFTGSTNLVDADGDLINRIETFASHFSFFLNHHLESKSENTLANFTGVWCFIIERMVNLGSFNLAYSLFKSLDAFIEKNGITYDKKYQTTYKTLRKIFPKKELTNSKILEGYFKKYHKENNPAVPMVPFVHQIAQELSQSESNQHRELEIYKSAIVHIFSIHQKGLNIWQQAAHETLTVMDFVSLIESTQP